MSGKSSRNSGHGFERKTASAIRHLWPEARRVPQYEAKGQGPDVDGTPYWIECKFGLSPPIRGAVLQAKEKTDGRPILAVTKKKHEETLVTMTWSHWLELMEAKYGAND